ncbi:putative AC9 transposase [Daphnia sinensis]|uniref:AC9 transposase n=1 Tax=Daphnia sinensis TaxID=1820382 RepID=A0AAD5PZA7_9CRUS|nr:putative AC9 transposase [Daphnia sinensis]
MWTAHRRSYIGITAHWLGSDLKRRSASLEIRRVKGRHTFDVIAAAINEIHKEFKIVSKVNIMITDSGSNFLKAFKIFGPNKLIEEKDSAQNEDEFEDYDYDDEDEDVMYIDLNDIFEENNHIALELAQHEEHEDVDSEPDSERHEEIKFPYHVKCPCHLLNPIATADIHKIINPIFKKMKKRLIMNFRNFGIKNI